MQQKIHELASKFARSRLERAQGGLTYPILFVLITLYNLIYIFWQLPEIPPFNVALALLCAFAALSSFFDLGVRKLQQNNELILKKQGTGNQD